MTKSIGCGRDHRRPVGPWPLAAGALFVGFSAWLVIGRPGERARQVASDLLPLVLEAVVIVVAWSCARSRATRRDRWAWALVTGAFCLYFLGDALWALFELVQERSPFPSAADGLYLAFYPVLLAGLLVLPGPLRKRTEWGRLALDVLTVTIAGGMAVWYLVIGPTLEQGSATSLRTVLSVAYPVGDLILVFGIATVILRGLSARGSRGLRWMAAGASAFIVADVDFAHLSVTSHYEPGSWPDLGWLLALVCFTVAADREHRRPTVAERRIRPTAPARVSVLPYLAIASSFALLIGVAVSQAGATVRTLLFLVLALTATVVARQVTAVRDSIRMTDELQHQAATDSLTSLSNRRHLLDVAEHEFTEAQRHDDDLAVIFLDVDHFKAINDLHGHAIGDAVLIWLGGQLRSILREEDLIGRFGGDEFVAVVPGLGATTVLSMANRLERAVATSTSPIEHGPQRITLSLGVATAHGCTDLDDLLARADAALYQAKRAGRSRVCLLDHDAAPTDRRSGGEAPVLVLAQPPVVV